MEELYEFMNKGSLCLEKDPTTEDAVEDSERQTMLYEVMVGRCRCTPPLVSALESSTR